MPPFSKNRTFIITALLLIAAASLFYSQARSKNITENYNTPITIITTNNDAHSFNVEIADTYKKREIGLMYRKSMPPNAGMIFFMERPGPQAFWMKNTYIPLDIMFIAENGTINQIHHNAIPHDTTNILSKQPAKAVLEINGGLSKKLGITKGSRVIHPFFEQKDKKDAQ